MFSHSRINCFKQCPKMFEYKYVQHLYPLETSGALNLGKAFHRGIELNSPDELAKELDENDYFTEENETEKVIAIAMVEAFLKRFPNHNEGNVEHEVHIEIPIDGEIFQMYADAIIDNGNSITLREYKTASRIDGTYIDKLKFNDQISRYCLAIEKYYNKPVNKIEYYIVKKPLLRLKNNETLEQYRARLVDKIMEDDSIVYEELSRTKEDLEEAYEDLKYDINTIKNTTRYTKCLNSCSTYGVCPYINLCCKQQDADLLYEKREEEE